MEAEFEGIEAREALQGPDYVEDVFLLEDTEARGSGAETEHTRRHGTRIVIGSTGAAIEKSEGKEDVGVEADVSFGDIKIWWTGDRSGVSLPGVLEEVD